MRWRKKSMAAVGMLGLAAVVLTAGFWMLNAVSNLRQGQEEQGKIQLEECIRRAAVACYATEGIYPPTLDYLEEHYGLQVDERHYTVYYDVFAENLMPDITVLENET